MLKRIGNLTRNAHKLGDFKLFKTLGILEMVKTVIIATHKNSNPQKTKWKQ